MKYILCCIIAALTFGTAFASDEGKDLNYSTWKLKQIINDERYKDSPDLQDFIFSEILLDFEGIPEDRDGKIIHLALLFGELCDATPEDHRYNAMICDKFLMYYDLAGRIILKRQEGEYF